MEKYYFTYGKTGFPFVGGWTEVYADDLAQAQRVFRAFHPDRITGILNCADYYESKRMPLELLENGNYGAFCHEKLGRNMPDAETVDRILNQMHDCAYGSMICSMSVEEQKNRYSGYVGAIEFAVSTGMIDLAAGFDRQAAALKEVEKYKKKIVCCFCGAVIQDRESNDASPLKNGRCCNVCNSEKVIPYRFKLIKEGAAHA